MPKIVDWSGQKFFYITLIEKLTIKNNRGSWLWSGLCDCGTIIKMDPNHIKRGSVKHCGCKRATKAKDWTNQTFNNLTFIKRVEKTIGTRVKWEVKCKCGATSIVVPYEVTSGKTKTCGKCERPQQYKNWDGVVRGSLTFIKKQGPNLNGQMIWEALCACNNTIYTIPSNNAQSCGCLGRQRSKEWCSVLGKMGRKYHPDESAARQVWQRYKDGDISFEYFKVICKLNCKYCGLMPSTEYKYNGGTFKYNGLDRVNSLEAHTVKNVVPCCIQCNTAKSNRSPEEFISHAKRILDYQSSLLNNRTD
jgi:hypothetical protein